jgi:hypothetical protein
MGLSVQPVEDCDMSWGYGDTFIPRKKGFDPLKLLLARDVLLMPDINLEADYTLGLKSDRESAGPKVYLCYRLNYYHEFGDEQTPTEEEFPVTVFWEMPSNRWRVSAQVLHGANRRTERLRPALWTDLLSKYNLSKFGELAEFVGRDEAMVHISSMMRIAVAHGVSRNELQKLRSGHGRRSR